MTIITRRHLQRVVVRVRRADVVEDRPIMLHRDGDDFLATYDPQLACLGTVDMLVRTVLASNDISVSEVIPEDHDADLTALFRACSKLRLYVEITEGPLITEPAVKVWSQDSTQASYFVPQGWDLRDALDRLPAAFSAAKPDIARNLKLIEETKKDSDGRFDKALDMTAALIVETGDPTAVYDWLVDLLKGTATESKEPTGVTRPLVDEKPGPAARIPAA
jgi:hypothetical protein